MDLQLKGSRALVTGASRGIGFAIAETLADEGVSVGICARNEENVRKALERLQARAPGASVIGDSVDVTDAEKYAGWIESAARRLGGLDLFVHNVTATSSAPGKRGWDLAYHTDILGAVRGVEAALPWLKQAKSAAIVMIASVAGVTSKAQPAPGAYAYGAAKAALIAYAAMISKDLAKQGIRVNTVSPGPVHFEGGAWDKVKTRMPQAFAAAEQQCPIGRLGKPEDIANAVAFLASPRSAFTVGQNLHIDGGFMQHVAF